MVPHARWCGPSGSTSSRPGAAGVVPGTAGPPAAGKPVAPAALLGATGGSGVQGDRAGRGVQQGGAALPPGLLAQLLADGLPCHLGELVDQVSVQMLQVIDAVHGLRVPAVTGA
ncbi:hypothetical protein [Streptomyces galbus]|uniref:hypothetical protein n=1 Tax=Streptomyces galbus TaxID=33898 RepID=UPI003EB814C0